MASMPFFSAWSEAPPVSVEIPPSRPSDVESAMPVLRTPGGIGGGIIRYSAPWLITELGLFSLPIVSTTTRDLHQHHMPTSAQASDDVPTATAQGVNSRTFHAPPLDCGLSVPGLYEYNAKHSPDHPVFCYAHIETGVVHDVTYSEAWDYIRSAARIIQSRIVTGVNELSGSSNANFRPVVAILAPSGTKFAVH